MILRVRTISLGELALRIQVLRDTAAYLGYVVAQDSAEDIIAELAEEVRALDPSIRLARLAVTRGDELVDCLARESAEIMRILVYEVRPERAKLKTPTPFEIGWYKDTHMLLAGSG